MKNLGLYLHIPFCVRKCSYCDFYSLSCANQSKISEYVSAVCAHIEKEAHLYRDRSFDTVFIGGGTPSLVDVSDFKRLAECIKSNLNILSDAEFSIEANPGTLDEKKLDMYLNFGVNRLSIGLQSSNDEELKMLGRIHTLSDFEKSFTMAREAGFDNINLDVMYALPNQSCGSFMKTLDYVSGFSPEHISSYCLKIEKGTHFHNILSTLCIPNEDEQYEMYISMCDKLAKCGYEQYEISNFAKKERRCVHNLKYWLSEDYLGFGPSAHSFIDGERYFYADSIQNYCDILSNGKVPEKIKETTHSLTKAEKMDEYVMLKMRLCDGICENEFKKMFGTELLDTYPKILKYIKSGHIAFEKSKIFFTSRGFFVSNYILSDILENI